MTKEQTALNPEGVPAITSKDLIQFRLEKNLTQQSFARLMGYRNYAAISRKEDGTAPITEQDCICFAFRKQQLEKYQAAFNPLLEQRNSHKVKALKKSGKAKTQAK